MPRPNYRELMPLTAALADSFRAAGINPAWMRATEAGLTTEGGRRTKDRETPPVPGVPEPRPRVTVIASGTWKKKTNAR